MKIRKLLPVLLLLAACSCGGSAEGGPGSATVFSLGTINRIDSLNPFVLTEPQAFTVADLVFPELVSYAGKDGTAVVGDWASSWRSSKDGRLWRFTLRPGKWSDGQPLTAEDAVWTFRTELRYKSGPTALVAGPLAGISAVSAPDPHTFVIRYRYPVGDALAQLASVWILPAHVWRTHVGDDGRDLKAFLPEQSLPMVAGGPYTVTRYDETRTTVLKANPGFYGARPSLKAIAITFYTNTDSLISDLRDGRVDATDQIPATTVAAVRQMKSIHLVSSPDSTVVAMLVNSNPRKHKNRELLDTRVREAISLALDRPGLVSVPFRGDARVWGNWVAPYSGNWADPSLATPDHDVDKANGILDSLGFERGSNGIRGVPATTGAHSQPAHAMSYPFAVPGDLPFNGSRAASEIAQDLRRIGIAIHEVDTGDTAAAYAYYLGPGTSYQTADLGLWYYIGYIDPSYILQFPSTGQLGNYNDTGFSDPAFDALYAQQLRTVNQSARRAIVYRMEHIIAERMPYIPLVATGGSMAYVGDWHGLNPSLYGWKSFFQQLRDGS